MHASWSTAEIDSQACLICKASPAGRTFHLVSMRTPVPGSYEWEVCHTRQLPDSCFQPSISPDACWAVDTSITAPSSGVSGVSLVHCNLHDNPQHVVISVSSRAFILEWLPAVGHDHGRMMYVLTCPVGPIILIDAHRHCSICAFDIPRVSRLVQSSRDFLSSLEMAAWPLDVSCLLDGRIVVVVHEMGKGLTFVSFR